MYGKLSFHRASPGEQELASAPAEEALRQLLNCAVDLGTPVWMTWRSQPADCCCEHCQLFDLHACKHILAVEMTKYLC